MSAGIISREKFFWPRSINNFSKINALGKSWKMGAHRVQNPANKWHFSSFTSNKIK